MLFTSSDVTVPTWVYLVTWISLSICMILMNKAILSPWHFGYPFFLTAWHMFLSTVITQIMSRTTNMLPGVKENKVSVRCFATRFIPISLFSSLSLMMGNMAYLYLSVSYIQMLKAFTPVNVLLFSFFVGLEVPSAVQLLIVSIISCGVALTSVGELLFSLVGFLFQLGGICAESSRLVMADKMLKDLKLDSLSTLYYIAPASFCFISAGFFMFEADEFPWDRLYSSFGFVLLFNGILAFALNVSVVLLIANTSALTFTIGGLFKDILLVTLSVIVFGSPVSALQIFGYLVSLGGMHIYKDFKSNPQQMEAQVKKILQSYVPALAAIIFGDVNEGADDVTKDDAIPILPSIQNDTNTAEEEMTV